MSEPRILALDTSSFVTSAAVLEGDRTLGMVGLLTRRPSRDILPLVERLFESLRLRPADMDAWAVTTGPGSRIRAAMVRSSFGVGIWIRRWAWSRSCKRFSKGPASRTW